MQIYDEIKRMKKSVSTLSSPRVKEKEKASKKFTTVELIFGLLFEYPDVLKELFDLLALKYLSEDEKSIYNIYKDNYNLLRAGKSREVFLSCFEPEVRKNIEITSLYIEEVYGKFNDEMIKEEFKALISNVRAIANERLKRGLTKDIREAEKRGENAYARELLQKLKTIVSS